jgi:hypothetical protein
MVLDHPVTVAFGLLVPFVGLVVGELLHQFEFG